jgi:hypothetical protein
MLCLFCRGGVEGRNHLFFEFSFCRRIWLGDLSKCLVKDPPYEWDAIVDLGVNGLAGRVKVLKAVLCKVVLSAYMYHIWRERNNIRHENQVHTEEQIIHRICWEVRSRIVSARGFPRNTEI